MQDLVRLVSGFVRGYLNWKFTRMSCCIRFHNFLLLQISPAPNKTELRSITDPAWLSGSRPRKEAASWPKLSVSSFSRTSTVNSFSHSSVSISVYPWFDSSSFAAPLPCVNPWLNFNSPSKLNSLLQTDSALFPGAWIRHPRAVHHQPVFINAGRQRQLLQPPSATQRC